MAETVRYSDPTLIKSPTRKSFVKLVPVPVMLVVVLLIEPAPVAVKIRSRLKSKAVAEAVSAEPKVRVVLSVMLATLRYSDPTLITSPTCNWVVKLVPVPLRVVPLAVTVPVPTADNRYFALETLYPAAAP